MILIALVIGISLIILLTARYRVHAFFALLLAALVVGICMRMPLGGVITSVKEGFGSIMASLGLIIVLGTTLGGLLEYTGSTRVLADFILRRTGEKRASLAMSLTGFIVGLPVFCDSGFIVLSGLNKSLARRTGIPIVVMSTALASGLYAVHCLIPPHPGAAAAAGALGVDFGKLILAGIPMAIPAMLLGHWWAGYASRRFAPGPADDLAPSPDGPSLSMPSSPSASSLSPSDIPSPQSSTVAQLPPVWKAILPIAIPVILIAIRSFLVIDKATGNGWGTVFSFLGDPVIALTVGILLAFFAGSSWNRTDISRLLSEAAEKAGGILVIIGAGGGFGAVIASTHPGQYLEELLGPRTLSGGPLGLLFPFLLTAVLKTAQGSSTVAIITAASIIQPILPALGLTDAHAHLFCVLSMGAGSMMISHANDAYFWVIARFSGLEMRPMLKVYSTATFLMGMVTFLMICLCYLLL